MWEYKRHLIQFSYLFFFFLKLNKDSKSTSIHVLAEEEEEEPEMVERVMLWRRKNLIIPGEI